MIVLVSGSRHMPASAAWLIRRELVRFDAEVPGRETMVLVHGGARGADTIAGKIAAELGWKVICEPADWDDGKVGGRERNQLMLSKWKPQYALFFHHSLTLGTGTFDMYVRCCRAGIPTRRIVYDAKAHPPTL